MEILEQPFGVPMTTPFPADHEHAAWDREYVERFGEALDWTDRVLDEFSGWFSGKTSPVHLFWGAFDLALTRFSGRRAPEHGEHNDEVLAQLGFSVDDIDQLREQKVIPVAAEQEKAK